MFDITPTLDCAGRPPAGPAAHPGIANVTPDSFSDGGAYDSTQAAIEHG